MNYRTILIAAVFHFVHQVEKDSVKHHKLTQNSVSFSCQSKQDSRCCINFLHELTCQILTNQNIKIARRAWSTRDCEKSQKLLRSLHVKGRWIFASEVEIKILKMRLMNTTCLICIYHLESSNLSVDNFKKTLELRRSIPEPAIQAGDTGQQKHYFDSCQFIKR